MKASLRRFVPWILAVQAVLAYSLPALADPGLITELESLRNSLPSRDPARLTLTLRLADVLFDEVGEITRKPELSASEQKIVLGYRQRALALYKDAMSGGSGQYSPVAGKLRFKVQFQMARISADLGLSLEAAPLWQALLAQQEMPELAREAALRLAESAESSQNHKEAETLYTRAIALCAGGETCSYAHYRRAWTQKNQDRVLDAITEIQLALYDSKGQLREEALRDLLVFLAAEGGTDGKKALDLVDSLASKLARPALLGDLADAFFSAGNRVAGTHILSFTNSRTPKVQNLIRLSEEYYGLRQIDRFKESLAQAQAMAPTNRLDLVQNADSEKVLRRLTVQLDGERISRPEFAETFRSTVSLYLTLFPSSKERMKMMEGWIASEKDPASKTSQLKAWLEDASFALKSEESLKLHEMRAATAQAAKDTPTVIEETRALIGLTQDPAKVREYRYSYARALYESKDYAASLPIFKELAQIEGAQPAQLALESQHLALDVLGLQKDYRAVMQQALTWTARPQLEATHSRELAEMRAISEKAEFELATTQGQSSEALAIFQKFCANGRLVPQSCDNARLVAVRTRNQAALLTVLKAQNATTELAAEYEASGYFSDAADLLSKNLKAGESASFLKVATLYELGSKHAERDRVLNTLVDHLRKAKSLGAEEPAIYLMLKDAGLIHARLLGLPWTQTHRAQISDQLESQGKGTGETRKILANSLESTGPAWDAMTLSEALRLDREQKKIGFYGRASRSKFEARLSALKKVVSYADKRLPGSSAKLRAELAAMLANSHHELAQEILKSPLPEQLNAEQMEQVQQSIAQMAEPFETKAKAYDTLAAEQSEKSKTQPAITQVEAPVAEDPATLSRAVNALHADPTAKATLIEMQNYYTTRARPRLAAYFKGRIAQLESEGGKP